ncbi:hypothetical protein SteCoe_15165 [Stentor coeruleus]|uniref:Dynein heavy chain coiled coil stalk domain-containing protein n=1 Tax=Stentor coeruleus TaxID=5963 RepID=A0A1R2C4G2_9CILI|nr:hypothetical protein SteCoe_15165 [Stentor coeruleus]
MVSTSSPEKLTLTLEIESLEASVSNYFQSSNDALFSIHKNALSELKYLRLPPAPIIEIIKAIAYLLGHKDNGDWESIRKYISDTTCFLEKLAKLHEEFIMTDEIKELVYPIIYESGFNTQSLMKYSIVISKLYLWADNFLRYAEKKECLLRLKNHLSIIIKSEECCYNENQS